MSLIKKSGLFTKKHKQHEFKKNLEDALIYKLNEYTIEAGKNDENNAYYVEVPIDPNKQSQLTEAAENIKEEAQSIIKKGKNYAIIIEENISPKIITEAKEILLKGSVFSGEGRVQKILALKDLCKNALSPMMALDLALLIMGNSIGDDAIGSQLNRIEGLITKDLHEKAIAKKVEYEDTADRLRFYLNTDSSSFTLQDKNHLEELSSFLHREVLTCAHLIQEVNIPQIKEKKRSLNEAKTASSMINHETYALIDRSITVLFLFVLCELTKKHAGSTQSYDKSWSLEEILLKPLCELMAKIYSELLFRLRLLLDSAIYINFIDKNKIKEILNFHESLFFPLDKKLKEFLNFYHLDSRTIWKIKDNTLQCYVKTDKNCPNAVQLKNIKSAD